MPQMSKDEKFSEIRKLTAIRNILWPQKFTYLEEKVNLA